ncbi:hypothetical protein F0P96_10420 [Hymenobacter busanensis]|uniref:Uncharacterized protein n=1 Tax=Hymenobacter busanensis TaxID=2607656 RepID=A0A7L4ZY41_9BACT|nr:hypothetical protein [Hymenobacter busanensis]KAA9333374.1 hypothetical protein F0P96_10420 [Hymenobacter busanensis]QHJ07947.1 hypothetical protein GUY19_11890 [Hymenobacter busanensis]
MTTSRQRGAAASAAARKPDHLPEPVRRTLARWHGKSLALATLPELQNALKCLSAHSDAVGQDVRARQLCAALNQELTLRPGDAPTPPPALYETPEQRRALYLQYLASGRSTPTAPHVPAHNPKPAPGGGMMSL